MRYDHHPDRPPRQRSAVGVVIATILCVVGFFLVGLFVLGVGFFAVAKSEAQRSHAIVQQERARSAYEQQRIARLQADLEQQRSASRAEMEDEAVSAAIAQTESAPAPIRVANREITVELSREGKIKIDGESIDRGQFKSALGKAVAGRESAVTVTVNADRQCMFEHVSFVLSVCRDFDIRNVRIAPPSTR